MTRVTLAGVGTVGRDVARLAAATDDVEIVAACSRNPDHVGRSLGELAGVGGGPIVCERLAEALETPSDVLLVVIASHLADVGDALRAGVDAGRDVLTNAEEAIFPWINDRGLADELDARSRDAGVTILGTGVNPGFAYDAVVLTLSGACWDLAKLRVERVVDISGYSPAVLRRSGVGFAPEEFRRLAASGVITGHIGFSQSIGLLADALGRDLERVERSIEPILALRRLEVAGVVVEAGQTAGFVQRSTGVVDGEPWFEADLVAHLDMDEAGLTTRDVIELSGGVSVRAVVEPAFDSQTTVAAVLVNSLRRLVAAPPGWLTVADLPPASAAGVRRTSIRRAT